MLKKATFGLSMLVLVTLISSAWPAHKVRAGAGEDLFVDGAVVSLSGTQEYDNVYVINGGQLRVNTSVRWLELTVTGEVRVDSSSSIVVDAMSSGQVMANPFPFTRLSVVGEPAMGVLVVGAMASMDGLPLVVPLMDTPTLAVTLQVVRVGRVDSPLFPEHWED